MHKLIDIIKNPSGFDSLSNYLGDLPDETLYSVFTRTRDSDILTESNFLSALELLGGESNTVKVIRFGHWACGWWESLSVVENTEAYKQAIKIISDYKNYPVINEQDYTNRKVEVAENYWKSCSYKEKKELCLKFNIPVKEVKYKYIPKSDNGSLFDYLTHD